MNLDLDDHKVLSEVRATLKVINERLDTLIKRNEEQATQYREMDKKIGSRHADLASQQLSFAQVLEREKTLREVLSEEVLQLRAYRENFWMRVLAGSAAVSTVVCAITGGIIFLIQSNG